MTNYLGSGVLLNKDIDKYGRDNFEREILAFYPTSDDAFDGEAATITQDMVDTLCVTICFRRFLYGYRR